MKPPKYPCADGLNRDKEITRMLELELEWRIAQRRLDELNRRMSQIITEMSDIEFNELGAIGHVAYITALNAIDTKAKP